MMKFRCSTNFGTYRLIPCILLLMYQVHSQHLFRKQQGVIHFVMCYLMKKPGISGRRVSMLLEASVAKVLVWGMGNVTAGKHQLGRAFP